MPRGIAVPEVRQQLFAALERLIVREGPARLTSRAITTEAGVAVGLLHAHFVNVDAFLVAYAVDRAFTISSATGKLAERAGSGRVADNLCEVVCSIPEPVVAAVTRLHAARPDLAEQVHAVLGDHTSGLDAIEVDVTGYLTAEQHGDRLAAQAAPEALAIAVVGAVQRLALRDTSQLGLRDGIRDVIDRLMTPIVDDEQETTPKPRPGTRTTTSS